MQTSSDDLFDLIKTLSTSEKRVFSIELKKPSKGEKGKKVESPQLVLFNTLNALEEYDEEKVKSRLAKRLGKSEKTDRYISRLATEKYNLYQLLLKVIRNFHSEKSDYARLKDSLVDAKQLLDRGLYVQSAKLLRKAKKLATKYDNQLALLEINRSERSLVWLLLEKNQTSEIDQLMVEKDQALKRLQIELSHQDYYDKISLVMAQHNQLTQIQVKNLKAKFQQFLFNENDEDLTPFARLRHIQTNGLFHILTREQAVIAETLNEEYQWWENNAQYKKEDFFRYRISLNNYLLANYRGKKFSIVLNAIETLENKENKSSLESLMFFEFTITFKLLIYLNTTQLEAAKALVPYIEEGMRKHFIALHKVMTTNFNLGSLFFLSEDFTISTEWLSKLIKGHNTDTREDIRTFANLILAVCYFELDQIEKMDNLFRAIQRSFREDGQVSSEDLKYSILTHLKRIAHAPLLEQQAILKNFKNDLQFIKNNDGKKKMIPFLDEFFIWAESRLSKRPMWEVLKEENEKHTD